MFHHISFGPGLKIPVSAVRFCPSAPFYLKENKGLSINFDNPFFVGQAKVSFCPTIAPLKWNLIP